MWKAGNGAANVCWAPTKPPDPQSGQFIAATPVGERPASAILHVRAEVAEW